MDSIYKKFIFGGIFIVILLKLIHYKENFSTIPSEDTTTQQIYNREKPPFNILKKKRDRGICFNTNDDDFFKADDDYELIPSNKRSNWRRPRDKVYIEGGKTCNRICETHKEKESPWRSYVETEISNYGVINPKIYTRKVGKMLEVYNTDKELVPVIKTSEKLPYSKKDRAAWTCQRTWLCFDPNKLLK